MDGITVDKAWIEQAITQALQYGNPLLFITAGLISPVHLLFKLPQTTDVTIRHAVIYDQISRLLPIDKQYHPLTMKHFLASHTNKLYACVVERNTHKFAARRLGDIHTDLRDINSPVLSTIVCARMMEDVASDAFMLKYSLVGSLSVLSNDVDDETLGWMVMSMDYPPCTMKMSNKQIPRWISAVVAADIYVSLPKITVHNDNGELDIHFVPQSLIRDAVQPLLARWTALHTLAPDYLRFLARVSYHFIGYIKHCNGLHSLNNPQLTLINIIFPKLLRNDWETITPIARGLHSLTHKALWKFSGMSNPQHYFHTAVIDQLIGLMSVCDPTEWFERHNPKGLDPLLAGIEPCNEENSLGYRIDSYSKSDYIVCYSKAGNHCHYFTREEYPTLIEKSKNFYTSEILSSPLLEKVRKLLDSSQKTWLLPARPWMINWSALQNGEWVYTSDFEARRMWRLFYPANTQCPVCRGYHAGTTSCFPITGSSGNPIARPAPILRHSDHITANTPNTLHQLIPALISLHAMGVPTTGEADEADDEEHSSYDGSVSSEEDSSEEEDDSDADSEEEEEEDDSGEEDERIENDLRIRDAVWRHQSDGWGR